MKSIKSSFTVLLLSTLANIDEGWFFFVNEYVFGENLQKYMKNSRFSSFSENDLAEIIIGILKGIIAIQENKVMYGSLKPTNVLFTLKD